MSDDDQIEHLRDRIYEAKKDLAEFIKKRWPEGAYVTWMKGGHLQYGVVLDAASDGLRVRNDLTGKSYWISVYDLQRAMRAMRTVPANREVVS